MSICKVRVTILFISFFAEMGINFVFCLDLFELEFVQSQRYPKVTIAKNEYIDFDNKKPAMANSRFVSKQRHMPGSDIKQLAEVMEKIFNKGIPECTYKGKQFPYFFTINASDEYPDYPDMESHITDCMKALKMAIPKYPSRRY